VVRNLVKSIYAKNVENPKKSRFEIILSVI
jgi:hypothetical protein